MPASAARVVALAAMLVIAPAAGLLLLVSVSYELGAYENTEPSEKPNELVAVAAAVALIAALVVQ